MCNITPTDHLIRQHTKHNYYVMKDSNKKHNVSAVFSEYVAYTLRMEGDEAVTKRPLVHGLIEDDILWEDDDSDVFEPAKPLQDLGHWLGL